MGDNHNDDKKIEIWKIKKLIKSLEGARGNGTSLISLIMPPSDQVSRVTKMLDDEYRLASNIKSRVNRQSVLGAITSAQQSLKLYNKVPPNGLVLYTGTIVNDEGEEKKITIDFEPFRPISTTLYLCDNKFHTEALNELLESDVNFIQEKRLIGNYFKEISQDTGKYVFGVDDTLNALDSGAVKTLIVWENLDINRYVLKDSATGKTVIKHLNKEQEGNNDLDVEEKMSLLEWLANEYKRFGCALEFVTNKSQEGSQFCRAFGGIGGILRYQLDLSAFDSEDGEVYDDDSE